MCVCVLVRFNVCVCLICVRVCVCRCCLMCVCVCVCVCMCIDVCVVGRYLSWSWGGHGLRVVPVLAGLLQFLKGAVHHLTDVSQTVHTHGRLLHPVPTQAEMNGTGRNEWRA